MKVLAVFILIIACVGAEFCDHDDDCTATVCVAGLKVDCYEHDGLHMCTCVVDGDASLPGYSCVSRQDCEDHWGRCHGDEHEWHCIDNACRCAKFNN